MPKESATGWPLVLHWQPVAFIAAILMPLCQRRTFLESVWAWTHRCGVPLIDAAHREWSRDHAELPNSDRAMTAGDPASFGIVDEQSMLGPAIFLLGRGCCAHLPRTTREFGRMSSCHSTVPVSEPLRPSLNAGPATYPSGASVPDWMANHRRRSHRDRSHASKADMHCRVQGSRGTGRSILENSLSSRSKRTKD